MAALPPRWRPRRPSDDGQQGRRKRRCPRFSVPAAVPEAPEARERPLRRAQRPGRAGWEWGRPGRKSPTGPRTFQNLCAWAAVSAPVRVWPSPGRRPVSGAGRLGLAPGAGLRLEVWPLSTAPNGGGPRESAAQPFTQPLRASVSPLYGGDERTPCRPCGFVTVSLQRPCTEGPAGCHQGRPVAPWPRQAKSGHWLAAAGPPRVSQAAAGRGVASDSLTSRRCL